MYRRFPMVLLLAACAAAATLACDPAPRHPRFLRDDQGRALVLHGMNVAGSAKEAPYLPEGYTPERLRVLSRQLGFNVIRYLLQWRAVEPQPRVYDDAYLEAVAERVRWAWEAGLYVILDMHQDVWGDWDPDRAGEGNGAPAWATRADGLPVVEFPPDTPWWLYSLQPRVMRAFDHFWRDTDLREHYAAMWARVARRFRDDPAVLGYDLMNEPFWGSDPVGFQERRLTRMYREAVAAIRAEDTENWIFVEPQSFGVNQGLASTLRMIDDPRPGENRIAYLPHFYPIETEIGGGYVDGQTTSVDLWQTSRVQEVDRLRMPLLCGEFGLAATTPGAGALLREFLGRMDRIGSGWMYWGDPGGPGGWCPIRSDHSEEPEIANNIIRTYPQHIAGDPVSYFYDPAGRAFSLTFRSRREVTAPTVISVPVRHHYPDGWLLEVTGPSAKWSSTWDESRELLSVTTDPTVPEWTIRVLPR